MIRKILFLILLNIVSLLIIQGMSLRVLTFNIRYENSKDSIYSWSSRKDTVIQYIKSKSVDVICFQEATIRQGQELAHALNDYSYVYYGRINEDIGNESVPIFYLREKFELEDQGRFWLSETPDSIGSIGWDAKLPRIVIWVKLYEKSSGKYIYVLNTHLDNKGRTARIEGMRLIKDSIRVLVDHYPIILTGDMNCSPKSYVYKIATEESPRLNDAFIMARIRSGVYHTYHGFGSIPQNRRKSRADYIFVSDIIQTDSVHVEEENDSTGIYLSDHNPVIAYLIL